MAVRDVILGEAGNGVQTASWADLDNGDSGKPVALAGWPDKTVTVVGGTTVDFQGSNDGGANWFPLNDAGGAALTTKAPGLYAIRENPLLIRPNNVVGNNMAVVIAAAR